jgi:hypothetical protein
MVMFWGMGMGDPMDLPHNAILSYSTELSSGSLGQKPPIFGDFSASIALCARFRLNGELGQILGHARHKLKKLIYIQ